MTERKQAARGRAASRPPRSRRRWIVAAAVAAAWVVLVAGTGSMTGATVVLVVAALAAFIAVLGLRALGVTRDHPWARQLASRPWRDGQDVLHLALRHLPEVFIISPGGALLAPNVVEVQLNPDDLSSLCERMDIGLVSMTAAEVYEEQAAAHQARFAGSGPVDVRVIASASVPPGRYRLRQGQPLDAGQLSASRAGQPGPDLLAARPDLVAAGPQLAHAVPQPARGEYHPAHAGPPYPDFTAHDGHTRAEHEQGRPAGTQMPTAMERRPIPVLRLVTGDAVAKTTTSGARAGRGDVELGLPQVPTVSREHARFTYSSGQWWIANMGRNGLTVNGAPVAGECPLSTGDSIRWGSRPDALQSWVEIT
jgi:hypothetical protein